jgi:hypothetical protein
MLSVISFQFSVKCKAKENANLAPAYAARCVGQIGPNGKAARAESEFRTPAGLSLLSSLRENTGKTFFRG